MKTKNNHEHQSRPRVRSRAKDAIKRFKFKHPNALKHIARGIVFGLLALLVMTAFVLVHYIILLIL